MKFVSAANNPAATSQTAASPASAWTSMRRQTLRAPKCKRLWTLDFQLWTNPRNAHKPAGRAFQKKCSTHLFALTPTRRIRRASDATQTARLQTRTAKTNLSVAAKAQKAARHWPREKVGGGDDAPRR